MRGTGIELDTAAFPPTNRRPLLATRRVTVAQDRSYDKMFQVATYALLADYQIQ
jgi:hypothetical protein